MAPSAALSPAATPTPTPTLTAPPAATPPPVTPTLAVTPTPAPTISLGFLTAGDPLSATLPFTGTTLPATVSLDLPGRTVPEPFGVNVYFTQAPAAELDQLQATGVTWVRMDLRWDQVERERGRYDFSAYDTFVGTMSARGLRILFILDYGNLVYGDGSSARTPEGRAAFARFAAAAVKRYRNRGILWEIWNEPNLPHFWHSEPNADEYADLALATIAAIRRVDPTALIVGPATSGFDWPYLERLGARGVLAQLDAVSIHPYRLEPPETVVSDYLRLRLLLDRFSPARRIPILSSEWGYFTAAGLSPDRPALYLARAWLLNLAHDVPLSIWYNWHDGGVNPEDPEQNFGLTAYDYTPKPAYAAAQTLLETLAGQRFLYRLPAEPAEDYLLLFGAEGQATVAAWTGGVTHTLTLPWPCETIEQVDWRGAAQTLVADAGGNFKVQLTPAPQYLRLCSHEWIGWWTTWWPEVALNPLPATGEGRLLVQVDNFLGGPLQGEFQVVVAGVPVGTAPVIVPPGEQQKVSVPVKLTAPLKTPTVATLVFLAPAGPPQAALIWLTPVQP